MNVQAAQRRLVRVVRGMARQRRARLEQLKKEAAGLKRPDFLWHYLLQSFSTMGKASGSMGLIKNQENYRRVTYDALAKVPPRARRKHVFDVCRAAKVRMPNRKTNYILGCFRCIEQEGGLKAAKERLLAQRGRDAKIRFLQTFPGIGPKYARNIMMDVYHKDFRDSIALDVRILSISKGLGLSFPDYRAHEQFYLDVAREAGLNGWELDRLLFNFLPEVESGLGIRRVARIRVGSAKQTEQSLGRARMARTPCGRDV